MRYPLAVSLITIILATFAIRQCKKNSEKLPNLAEQPGLLQRDSVEDKIIIQAAYKSVETPEVFLQEKFNGKLETKIRGWFSATGRELSRDATIQLAIYFFFEGDTMRQEIADPNSKTGRDTILGYLLGNHVITVVGNDPTHNGEYVLCCMNRIVGEKQDHHAQHGFSAPINDGFVIIKKGGSVCGDLDMTWQEALKFAQSNHLKHWWKNGVLYIEVYSGDTFEKRNGAWVIPAVG